MQLVEDDALDGREQIGGVRGREQQRQLFRGREQDVGRIAALAQALSGRCIAGAGLDADRQRHLGDRRIEIACDIDRQGLEGRDIERVQAAAGIARIRRDRGAAALNSTSVGRKPASVLPAPVGAISSVERPVRAFCNSAS